MTIKQEISNALSDIHTHFIIGGFQSIVEQIEKEYWNDSQQQNKHDLDLLAMVRDEMTSMH